MESQTNYTFVGLVVLILTASLLSAGMWLSIGLDRKQYKMYTVYVGEAVSGLSDDSVVKYNGVKVGLVNKIELNQFDPRQVKIQLKIEDGTPITIGTEATLINQGITGVTYLGLSTKSASLLPLQRKKGEPYPVIPYKPSFISQLEKNLNYISTSIKQVFNEENGHAFKKTLANIEVITKTIAKNEKNLSKSLEDLPVLISDLKAGVGKFSEMSVSMSQAGKQVGSTMRSGKIAINKLSEQTLPPINIFLTRLDVIAANLEKMSAELRQNPSIIIRGTVPPKSGPGE